MRVSLRVWIGGILALLLLPSLATAQSSATGSLSGTVADSSGAVLPGVTVLAVNPETGVTQSVVTGSSGEWSVSALPVGRYDLSFELNGFKKLTRSDVLIEAVVTRRLNITLEVGAMTEQVTVSGDAPLVVANTAATYRRLAADELTQVPTSTRSFTHLLSAEAGVSADLPPVLINGTGNISPSVNGTRTTSTSLFFNGIDATNLTSNEGSMTDNISPAPETLEEVKLQTSLYDASTGRSGGGNFQLVTRAARNSFHGGALLQLPAREASTPTTSSTSKDGIDKPKARRNEGGFTVGGPMRRNKLFFFGGYQRTEAETGFVPTASSITVLPAALSLIQGARTKENLLAAFAQLNPGISASIPKAQCASADRHGVHFGRRGGLLQPAESGDRRLRYSGAARGLAGRRQRHRRAGSVGRRQPARPPAQRRAGRVQAGPVHAEARRPAHEQPPAERHVLLRQLPGLRSVPGPVEPGLAVHAAARGPERAPSRSRTRLDLRRATRSTRCAAGSSPATTRGSSTIRSSTLTNAAVGVPNPATFFDESMRRTRLGHYVGAAGHDHGALLVRRPERHVQPAASSRPGPSATR